MKKQSQTALWSGLAVFAVGNFLHYTLHTPAWVRIVLSLVALVLFAASLVLEIAARRGSRQQA